MSQPIVNRVAQSPLKVIDLMEYHSKGPRSVVDVAQWLEQGFILREKSYRVQLDAFDWSIYQNHFVAIQCSTDAILPSWALLLVQSKLIGVAQQAIIGTLDDLEKILFTQQLLRLDLSPYQDAPVIVKGCSEKEIPQSAYALLLDRLQSVAKKISFGEACSAVPIWMRNK